MSRRNLNPCRETKSRHRPIPYTRFVNPTDFLDVGFEFEKAITHVDEVGVGWTVLLQFLQGSDDLEGLLSKSLGDSELLVHELVLKKIQQPD